MSDIDNELDKISRMRESLAFKILELLSISHKPLRPLEIAEILGASQKDITATLIRLNKKGLVVKVPNSKVSLWTTEVSLLKMVATLWGSIKKLESKYEDLDIMIQKLKGEY